MGPERARELSRAPTGVLAPCLCAVGCPARCSAAKGRGRRWVQPQLPPWRSCPWLGGGRESALRFSSSRAHLQSQAMVRAVARQVCEQLIQSKCCGPGGWERWPGGWRRASSARVPLSVVSAARQLRTWPSLTLFWGHCRLDAASHRLPWPSTATAQTPDSSLLLVWKPPVRPYRFNLTAQIKSSLSSSSSLQINKSSSSSAMT